MQEDNSLYIPIAAALITFLIFFIYYQYKGFKIKVEENLIVQQNPDTAFYDAFGRERVSQPYIIFESKQNNDNNPLLWDQTLVSGDSTSGVSTIGEWEKNRASTTIKAQSGISGDFIRQTYRRFNYQPGKSQHILMTANILRNSPDSTKGVTIILGSLDDYNGIYFEYNQGTMYCVVKSNVNGTPSYSKIAQNDWNIDKMDGKGPSSLKIEWNKVHIYLIDYAWLGVGRIRFGFIINGITYYVHNFLTANKGSSVYISNPNLPLRFQLITTTETENNIWSEQICSAVTSEGGDQENIGIIRNESTETYTVPDANHEYLLITIRQKEDYIDTTIFPNLLDVFNADATQDQKSEWYLVFDPQYSQELDWQGVSHSAIEYAVNNTTDNITVTEGYKIKSGYTISGKHGAGQRNTSQTLEKNILLLGTSIGGGRQTLAITTKLLNGATNVDTNTSFSWKEL